MRTVHWPVMRGTLCGATLHDDMVMVLAVDAVSCVDCKALLQRDAAQWAAALHESTLLREAAEACLRVLTPLTREHRTRVLASICDALGHRL